MALGMEVCLSPGDFVLDGDPAISKMGAANFYCAQTAVCITMPLGVEYRPHPRGLCVRWGPSPLPNKGAEPPPQFSAHVYCGQTAGWIKMAPDMEVGLGPGHIVVDEEPAPLSQNGGRAPSQFLAHFYCCQTAG